MKNITPLPKEEQKQHLINMMQDDEKLGLYNETLEEVVERLESEYGVLGNDFSNGFIEGVIWKERNSDKKWSDEDMKLAYYSGKENEYNFINKYHFKVRITFEEWFEQFKKR